MVIATTSKPNRPKPQRGGTGLGGSRHAAPRGLEAIIRGAVSINMPLLRSWERVAAHRKPSPEPPNPATTGNRLCASGFGRHGRFAGPRFRRGIISRALLDHGRWAEGDFTCAV